MGQLIAMCGLNCSQCEGYLATQANDEAAKERVAIKWQQLYNAPGITAASVTCDGCMSAGGRLGGHCAECEIRACGLAHQIPNCAHCSKFGTCPQLAGFLNFVPEARNVLQAIRSTL